MKLVETGLPGCVVIQPRVFEDARGSFHEAFNLHALAEHGLEPRFVQGNVSTSNQGVLRGLHYQWPRPQGKYVSVLQGEAWDVAVDIRRGSPTFGRWTAVLLSAANRRQCWIPEGFAHGFVALAEHVVFAYLCTAPYDPAGDRAIRWNDPALAIDWPIAEPRLSDRDARAPLLADLDPERLPQYEPAPLPPVRSGPQ